MIEIIPNFHPAIVHFPIAFTAAAVAFTAIGTLFKNWSYAAQCRTTGRWMLWGAALFALIAAVFGWLAFNSVAHDEVSHAAMKVHRNWALGTVAVLLALAAWDVWRGRTAEVSSSYALLGGLVLAWLLVTSTAWHGAELVYRHGMGVMSMPKPEGEGHAHGHGEGHGDMPAQGGTAPREDGHARSHEGAVNGEHPHDAVPGSGIPAADTADMPPKKIGHAHAPGTPPHKD